MIKPRTTQEPAREGVASAAGPQVTTPTLSPSQAPRPVAAGEIATQSAVLSHLLKIESDIRRAGSVLELAHLLANEMRGLVRARQVFVIERQGRTKFAVCTVSSLATVDRHAPLVHWIEDLTGRLARTDGVEKLQEFVLPAYCDAADTTASSYPFANMLWVPLWHRGSDVTDGILLARETAWLDSDHRIASRLAETSGHAMALLRARRRPFRRKIAKSLYVLVALPLMIALGFVPVPMTTLAPLEVAPRDPHIVSMPVDGIVQSVLVAPNEAVRAGQPLVRLNDTMTRNKLELATREVAVAEARVERNSSLSFSDPKGRHELGIARAELALRVAERKYARELLDQASIVAAADGVAVFSDRKDVEGKPLATGERIMQIARQGVVELKIELSVADSIALRPSARVKAFLDSDPLMPVDGIVSQVDYQARLSDANVAVYRVVAQIVETGREPPRLGTRGTAQLYGPSVSLALFLFRRPLSALRQWAGL